MTQPSRDGGPARSWASVWPGQARSLAASSSRTRSAPAPRHLGHHIVGLGPRTDVDPDDQVPVLHWDQPPGIGDGTPPATPIVPQAADDVTDQPITGRPIPEQPITDQPIAARPNARQPRQALQAHPPMTDRSATEHPVGPLPRQRTAAADHRPAFGQVPAATPTAGTVEHPATHFHPPRMR